MQLAHFSMLFLLVSFFGGMCPGMAAEGEEETMAQKLATPLPLKVEIVADSDTVAVRTMLPNLHITVTNVSPVPVRIPTNWDLYGGIAAKYPSGEQLTFLRDWLVHFDGTRDQTIVLPPGSWFGQTLSRTTKLPEPGNWTVWWTLRVPMGTDDVPLEPGIAKSNVITVTATR